jgi:hypothetical protein
MYSMSQLYYNYDTLDHPDRRLPALAVILAPFVRESLRLNVIVV